MKNINIETAIYEAKDMILNEKLPIHHGDSGFLTEDMARKYLEEFKPLDDLLLKEEVSAKINERIKAGPPKMNRAQRRAWERQIKKSLKSDEVKEETEKLAYIETIKALRKVNERLEKEGEMKNEDSCKDH